MIEEEAIRAAFAVIADEAVSPERTRATLAARLRHHRQRRMVLRVAGLGTAAAAAGLTGVGVRRLLEPQGAEFPEIAGGPGGGWLKVPLRYRPTWLPDRFGQRDIAVGVVGDLAPMVSRTWRRPGDGGRYTPTIGLTVGWHDAIGTLPTGRTETVDIGGVTGQLIESGDAEGGSTHLVWQPVGQPRLVVAVIGDADSRRGDALRVARSVQPDRRHTWVGPRFGWLPADLAGQPWRFHVGYDDATWTQGLTITLPDGGPELMANIGPGVHRDLLNRDAAEPIRVRGLDGWQVPTAQQLFLTLPDGVQAYFGISPADGPGQDGGRAGGMAQLIQIVEDFDFGWWPDMSWVGTR